MIHPTENKVGGPLQGLKVIEMVGIGPVPFCALYGRGVGAARSGAMHPQPVPGGPAS